MIIEFFAPSFFPSFFCLLAKPARDPFRRDCTGKQIRKIKSFIKGPVA